MKKRFLSIMLTLCMVLMFVPTTAFAADPATDIPYMDASGTPKTCESATVVASGDYTWGDDENSGWYIAQGNVTIEGDVTVNGDVHLILADECNLIVNGSITGGSLTIYGQAGGTGTLDVTGRITGGYGEGRTGVGGGNITIKGGVVKAESITGGTGGDGIVVEGQPPTFYNGSVGGDITISGGVVEAGSITGGKGGNSQGGTGGRGGNITISGGVVKAESITGGIGGTDPGDGCGGGSVAITGGVVDATRITGGYGNGSIDKDGSVDITGGIVFQSDDGQVYGTDVTLSKSFTISEGKTLTIESGKILIIPDGVILTNNGTINNNGTITNNGKIYVDGTFTGTADNLYYPLTIVGASASGDISEYNGKTYGKAGSKITLTSYHLSTGYKLLGWDVPPANTVTMVGENTYEIIMPEEALTVTAQYKDIAAPVILGIEDGKTYCNTVEFTVSDNDRIASVKAGDDILIAGTNGKYTLEKGKGKVTVVATDNTGNTTPVTVTVNNGHTGGEATCKVKAVCDYCGSEYGELDSTNHNLEKIPAKAATVTETGSKEYWHCLDCGKYFSDADGTNEITDLESWKTGDGKIDKLPPEIIEGKGQSITAGEKKELTFKSNAAFSDFIRAQLDGKTLDEKNYTVKEGSTIVTLKEDFVTTLSAGEHIIGIVSTNGTAATTFTVAEAQKPAGNNSNTGSVNHVSRTGDNSHMALWIALLFVSGGAVIGRTVVRNKKKNSK